MQLSELRTSAKLYVRAGNDFADADYDRAARDCLNYMVARGLDVMRSTATVTVSANNPQLDLTAPIALGFRAERFIMAEVGYVDEGTWATGTSYDINDLVQGDGDPDSFLYVCTEAHTSSSSNEPGGTGGAAFWTRVDNRRGTRLRYRAYSDVVNPRGRRHPLVKRADGWYYYAYDDYQNDAGVAGGLTGDRPSMISFRTATDAYVSPTPERDFPVNLVWRSTVPAWEYGGTGTVEDIEFYLPDEYTTGLFRHGIPAALLGPESDIRGDDAMWRLFENDVELLLSHAGVRPQMTQRRPNRNGL